METLRNPLMASFPLGRVPLWGGRRPPLRVSWLMLLTVMATTFAFTGPDESAPTPPAEASRGSAATSAAKPNGKTAATSPTAAPLATSDSSTVIVSDDAAARERAADRTNADRTNAGKQAAKSTASAVPTRGLRLGLMVAILFFGSALLHVTAETFAALRSGGGVRAAVVWPVGGRVVSSDLDAAGVMQTAVAGPLSHVLLCLLTLPAVATAGATSAFSLTSLPDVWLNTAPLQAIGLLIFGINLKLLFVNLLPVPPLSGSRLIRGWNLSSSVTGREELPTVATWVRLSFLASLFLVATGVSFNNVWITALGAILLAGSCVEVMAFLSPSSEAGRETGAGGYDFSEGYTSLERDADAPPVEPAMGPLARWKSKRATERRRREREEREFARSEIDRLLAKVAEVGMAGLTGEERATLTRLSSKLKDRS